MNGKSSLKSILSQSLTRNYSSALVVLMLITAGIFLAVVRAHLRLPLNIPGRHGIEVMAILMTARMLTTQKFATTITMLAASTMMFLPFLGFKDPTIPAVYIFIGFIMDFIWNRFSMSSKNLFFISIFGGFIYMLIPIFRIGIHLTHIYPVTSFVKHGFVTPIFTHFLFGALGAFISALIIRKTIQK